ncbi:MAG: RDD family protein [Marmoricola sp.]
MSEPYAAAQRPADQSETASWLRRIGALFIDWLACYLVTFFILRDVQHQAFGALSLIIFWLESAVGIALTGSSFGQLVLKIGVRHPDGRPLTLLGALLRQLLVCLVIPPLVFRPDGRGLHDMWTDSGAYPKA